MLAIKNAMQTCKQCIGANMHLFQLMFFITLIVAAPMLLTTMHAMYFKRTHSSKTKTTRPLVLTGDENQTDLISAMIPYYTMKGPIAQSTFFANPNASIATVHNANTTKPDLLTTLIHQTTFISTRVPSRVIQGPITQNTFLANPAARIADVSCAQANFKMFVHDPIKCQYISQGLLHGGWECSTITKIIDIMNQKIDGDDAYFMDIGSNIGAFSLNVAHSGSNVVAFEAMTYNIELQRASIGTFPPRGNLILFQTAVSFTDGPSMCIAAAKGGDPLINTGNGQLTHGCEPMAEHVSVHSINSILTQEGMNTKCFTVVKADIEGFEALAFQGASNIFHGRCPPCVIFFEYNEEYTIMATNSSRTPFNVLSLYEYVCSPITKTDYVCNLKKNEHLTRCSPRVWA
jgi:FkbM family methyltransferase